MKKYEELSNPTSCLNKAHDHEPLFIIRGKDPAAAIVILAWVEERIDTGQNTRTDPKIRSALALASDMQEYQDGLAPSQVRG